MKFITDIPIFSYKVETTALEGSVSTPFFNEPFDENVFKPWMRLDLYINVPQSIKSRTNMRIVISVQYDTTLNEQIIIGRQKLDKNEKNTRKTFFVTEDLYFIKYYRRKEIKDWKNRRNTGMNVTWYYTDNKTDIKNKYLNDNKYLDDNKKFLWIANLIHEKGLQFGESLFNRSKSKITFDAKCNGMEISDEKSNLLATYENVSSKPAYIDISDDTLALAAKIYFSLVFCADNVAPTVEFYQNLFKNFPTESILKTLARLAYMAKEKNLTEHYRTAMFFLNEITSTLNLTYKDIAVMTTSFTELQDYEDLKYHIIGSEDLLRDSSEVERLI